MPNYHSQATIDTAIWYCPYVPLQYVHMKVVPKRIIRENLSFIFDTREFHNAFQWVINDCAWNYKLVFEDDHQYKAKITFEKIAGAIEFKMRFC